MNQITLGMIAHVDAGKTTLTEALLYECAQIHEKGRVDKQNTFLDHNDIERRKGITVFSKQAVLETKDMRIILLDTPGHADLSPEAERALRVLDYAVLIVSANDGIQAHTETLWHLLEEYHIPTFIFVSKTDLSTASLQQELMDSLQQKFGEGCIAFHNNSFQEDVALRDEAVMEEYLQTGAVAVGTIQQLVRNRSLFPVYFGSALKQIGIDLFLQGICRYTVSKEQVEPAAVAYKIQYDKVGTRLTFFKVEGGCFKVRDNLQYIDAGGESVSEKISGIRLYSGEKYTPVQEAFAGGIYAFTGLSSTYAGIGIGTCASFPAPLLLPCMSYCAIAEPPATQFELMTALKRMEEEEPALQVTWKPVEGRIDLRLMGSIQLEVLQEVLQKQYGIRAQIRNGTVLYRETVASNVEGIGHYEPLRHYAEVHVLLKPLKPGDGLVFRSNCDPNALDRNWQRLILSMLRENEQIGTLTGAPLTDTEITMISGKAHLKHTEGGDFREAACRAVRNGLMKAGCVLLEPFYSFELCLPSEHLGHAIQDLQEMRAQFQYEVDAEGFCRITGSAAVSKMNGYQATVASYSHGAGRLSCTVTAYLPCLESEKVIAEFGYDPEHDVAHSADSVFCSHGAGHTVKWNEVEQFAHIPALTERSNQRTDTYSYHPGSRLTIDEKELEEILNREFGPIRRPQYGVSNTKRETSPKHTSFTPKRRIYLIDGYNLLYSWPVLKDIAPLDLELARERMVDLLSSYSSYSGAEVIVVFDAYHVKDNPGSKTSYKNITIAYTKEQETADAYIERLSHQIGKNDSVTVVTSDRLIQVSADAAGVSKQSSDSFQKAVAASVEEIRKRKDVLTSGT